MMLHLQLQMQRLMVVVLLLLFLLLPPLPFPSLLNYNFLLLFFGYFNVVLWLWACLCLCLCIFNVCVCLCMSVFSVLLRTKNFEKIFSFSLPDCLLACFFFCISVVYQNVVLSVRNKCIYMFFLFWACEIFCCWCFLLFYFIFSWFRIQDPYLARLYVYMFGLGVYVCVVYMWYTSESARTHTHIYIWIFIFCELILFQCGARICFECSCNRMTISA